MKDVDFVCMFFKSIIQLAGGNIVIYGVKEYAKLIGSRFPENVAGYLDRDKTTGSFLGKPVLTLSDLPERKIRILVIAASIEAEAIVYERIHQECERIGLRLYGLHSGELTSGHVGKLLPASDITGEDLKKCLLQEIARHDVISFDIFDTLLMRRVLYPTDIFDIVGSRARKNGLTLPDNFKDYRMQAEAIAASEHGGLDGIYKELRAILNLTTEEAEQICQLEIAVERDALLPRPDILEAFAYARKQGKQIILASDMYLPSAMLSQLLEENGYAGVDNIYVSDERGMSKQDGLFRLIRQDYPEASIMHVGDNYKADIWPARCCGIDVFPIQSSLEMFLASGISQPFKYLDNINERLLMGLFLNRAYGSPFAIDSQGKRDVVTPVDFVKLFIVPLSISFICWIIKQLQGKDYDAALFAARDGYLILKMYEIAVRHLDDDEMPKGLYFYTSRMLCIGSALSDDDDLLWLKEQYQYDIRKFLDETLGIDLNITSNIRKEDNHAMWEAVMSSKEKIFEKSKKFRKCYEAYMSKNNIKNDGHYAFVDLDSRGTSQRMLVHSFWPDLYGLYFHRWISYDGKYYGKMKSFLPVSDRISLAAYVFEYVFTSPEPSAISMDETGRVILGKDRRTLSDGIIRDESQKAILAAMEEFMVLYVPEIQLSCSTGQQLLELYKNDAFRGARDCFDGVYIHDDFDDGKLKCLE